MLSLPPSVKIFVARSHVDMRKAFDGLSAVVRDILSEDPLLCGELQYVAGKARRIDLAGITPDRVWQPAT